MATMVERRSATATHLARAPIIGVVRTASTEEAALQARALVAAGLQWIEITFSVPNAPALLRELLAARRDGSLGPADLAGPAGHDRGPLLGMGTVSTPRRAAEAVAAGAEFLVTPNVQPEVAARARENEAFLVMGALTPSEIVAARELGADLVKVYPLPPVGGPAYLSVVRQPLGDIPMLAAGGFGIEEIPAYRQAGAIAFGIACPILLGGPPVGPAPPQADAARNHRQRIARALAFARGEAAPASGAGGPDAPPRRAEELR